MVRAEDEALGVLGLVPGSVGKSLHLSLLLRSALLRRAPGCYGIAARRDMDSEEKDLQRFCAEYLGKGIWDSASLPRSWFSP